MKNESNFDFIIKTYKYFTFPDNIKLKYYRHFILTDINNCFLKNDTTKRIEYVLGLKYLKWVDDNYKRINQEHFKDQLL